MQHYKETNYNIKLPPFDCHASVVKLLQVHSRTEVKKEHNFNFSKNKYATTQHIAVVAVVIVSEFGVNDNNNFCGFTMTAH